MRETTCSGYKTHFIKSFDKQAWLNVKGYKEQVCWLPHQPCKNSSFFKRAEGWFSDLPTWGRTIGQPLTADPQTPAAMTGMAALKSNTVIPVFIKYLLYPVVLASLYSVVLVTPRTHSCNKFVQTFFFLQDLTQNMTQQNKEISQLSLYNN